MVSGFSYFFKNNRTSWCNGLAPQGSQRTMAMFVRVVTLCSEHYTMNLFIYGTIYRRMNYISYVGYYACFTISCFAHAFHIIPEHSRHILADR